MPILLKIYRRVNKCAISKHCTHYMVHVVELWELH